MTNNADSGNGSLRDAIVAPCTGSAISFSGTVASLIKLNSRLRIDDDLTIQGPGSANLAIDGQNATRLLFIGGGNVTLSELTLRNGLGKGGDAREGGGAAGLGGAIFFNAGSVTATGIAFSGNKAQGSGAIGNGNGGGGGFGGDSPRTGRGHIC